MSILGPTFPEGTEVTVLEDVVTHVIYQSSKTSKRCGLRC